MVQGRTYKTSTGQYVTKENVQAMDKNTIVHASTKEKLQIDWEKMSKSKHNGVDPEEIVDKYGVDFTRILMLSFVHPRSLRNFTRKRPFQFAEEQTRRSVLSSREAKVVRRRKQCDQLGSQ